MNKKDRNAAKKHRKNQNRVKAKKKAMRAKAKQA